MTKKTVISAFFILSGLCSYGQTWLNNDTENNTNEKLAPANSILESFSGNIRPVICKYNAAKLISTVNDTSCNIIISQFNKRGDFKKAEITFEFTIPDKTENAGTAVAIDLNKWSEDNYVMIPASVYNGNRNRIEQRDYATGLNREDLYRKDLPLTTALVPHLSTEKGTTSKIEVNSSNATTPAICAWDRNSKKGVILLAEQGIKFNDQIIDNGLIVEENEDKTKAVLVVSAPGVREFKPEFIGFSESPDRSIKTEGTTKIDIKIQIYTFTAENTAQFLDIFTSLRKELTGENNPRNIIPSSEVIKKMTKNIDNRYYAENGTEFYCPENANWISFGWIGGLINTFPMIALADSEHRQKVSNTFDFAFAHGQGESGYFYGALNYDGKPFGREGYDEFPEIVLTRKNSDVLFWGIKQFMLLKSQGNSVKPEWEHNIKRLADAFVNTWEKSGTWGNFLNNKTGEVAVYNTTSGAMTVGGLALAAEYFNNNKYMTVAKEAAEHYYNDHFLELGMTTGGCADILQNADSETAVALMTSFMALYETTGEKIWLDRSQDLANLCATWTVSYDYILPKETPLAKLDARLSGAVWASTQNKHGAPGFCTSSGDPLFKIYRQTGDKRYAELMRDIIHAHAEGIQPNGLITERLTYCDADSRGSRGDGGKTGWNELNGALMAMEIPGIYIRKDQNEIYVFDHVEAKIASSNSKELIVTITNPTDYDAEVSVLAETVKDLQTPIGYTSFKDWEKVKVASKSTVNYTILK